MTQPRVDGRTARSERTRNAIVDAHLQLIREGDLRPTADRIAKQAGVSLRVVQYYFTDKQTLLNSGLTELAARLDRLADQRLAPAAIAEHRKVAAVGDREGRPRSG